MMILSLSGRYQTERHFSEARLQCKLRNSLNTIFYKHCHCILQELYIDNLQSPAIGKWAFRGLPELIILAVGQCGLVIAPNIRSLALSLRDLYLYGSNITTLPSNYFDGFDMLHTLFLAHNKFRSIPNITVISDTLKILSMNDNVLSDIRMLYQVELPRLEMLDLSNNHIVSFPFPKWEWPQLRDLTLQGNLLQSITHQWLWNSIVYLSLTANPNPWNCSQDLCWIQHCILVADYSAYYKCGINGRWLLPDGGLQCASPEEWKGQRIEVTGNIHVTPDNKIHVANMGHTWGRQDPGGPHVGHIKLAIREHTIICQNWASTGLNLSECWHFYIAD